MKPLKTADNFIIQELVHPDIYHARRDLAWHLLDPALIVVADRVREHAGPTYCNTWALSESLQEAYTRRTLSGLRPFPDVSDGYSRWSQHCYGQALDLVFQNAAAEEVRHDIVHKVLTFDVPVILETTMNGKPIGWLHIAVGNYAPGQIYTGNPSLVVV